MKRPLLLLFCLTTVAAYSQVSPGDTLDLSSLIPPKGNDLVFRYGEEVRVKRDLSAYEKRLFFKYNFQRLATKKEKKKPELIDGREILFEDKIYKKEVIDCYGFYKDTGEVEMFYELIGDGFVPLGLELINKKSIPYENMLILHSTEKYLVCEWQEQVIVCYYPSPVRNDLFEPSFEDEEFQRRKLAAKNFLNKDVRFKDWDGIKISGEIISIKVEPYRTDLIVLMANGHNYTLKMEHDFKIVIHVGKEWDLSNQNSTHFDSIKRQKNSPSSNYKHKGGRTYYTGPRGGCYYLTSGGNKKYVDRSFCK